MQDYSLLSLLRHGLNKHQGWTRAWRAPPLKPSYDVVIIGGLDPGMARCAAEKAL